MENRYTLFHIALVLNILILVVSFTGVMSAPVKLSITEFMKNDTNLCETSKFLYDSEYTKRCASLPYPIASLNLTEKTLDIFLCLGIYDTAYKICQYSSQLSHQISPFSTTVLTQYVEKSVSDENLTQEKEFCDTLQGFTSLYSKIDSLLKPLVDSLNKSHKCQKICFDLNDKIKPSCAIFSWIKKFDDIKKAKRTEIKQNLTISDKLVIQSNETANKMIVETKKTSDTKENNEQNINKIIANPRIDNNVEEDNLNVPENVSTVHAEFDEEKIKSEIEKSNKAQKLDNAILKTEGYKSTSSILEENKKNIMDNKSKNIPANNDIQVPAMNNVPKIDAVNEEKEEEFNKEQNINDLKTSTLSENTQDHYDAGNLPEDVETNVAVSNTDDVDDAIQQSTRNQNENTQEIYEQKNLRYPNLRTEDDSHFFTYFTVITVACIAGYIGYHNKQKILAIVLEGRRSRNNRGRRRPSTANYRKLDCTLEEAVTSQCNANVTHVIY